MTIAKTNTEKHAKETAIRNIEGMVAKVDLDMHGHEMVIGYATVRLLERGEPVTALAIFKELNALDKTAGNVWEKHLIKAFPFLEQLIENDIPPEKIEEA